MSTLLATRFQAMRQNGRECGAVNCPWHEEWGGQKSNVRNCTSHCERRRETQSGRRVATWGNVCSTVRSQHRCSCVHDVKCTNMLHDWRRVQRSMGRGRTFCEGAASYTGSSASIWGEGGSPVLLHPQSLEVSLPHPHRYGVNPIVPPHTQPAS